MRRSCAAALGLLFIFLLAGEVRAGELPAPSEPTDAELRALLAAAAKGRGFGFSLDDRYWKALGLERPRAVIQRAAGERPEPGHVTAQLQQAYGLAAPTARGLLAAELLAFELQGSRGRPAPDRVSRVYALATAAALAQPDTLAPVATLLALLVKAPPEQGGQVLQVLQQRKDPAAAALRLAGAAKELRGDWAVVLAGYAVSRKPTLLPQASALFTSDAGPEAAAFQLSVLRTLRRAPGASVPRELSETLLRSFLKEDLQPLALEVLRGMPPEQLQGLQAGRWDFHVYYYQSGKSLGEWEKVERPASDLRPDVAALLLETGDRKGAAQWAEAARRAGATAPTDDFMSGQDACARALQLDVLDRLLSAGPAKDPFPLLVQSRTCQASKSPIWNRLKAPLLHSRFPDRARADLAWPIEYAKRVGPEAVRLQGQVPFLADAQRAIQAAQQERRAREERALAALGPVRVEPAVQEGDTVAAGIARRLAEKPLFLFGERALTAAEQKQAPSRWQVLERKSVKPPEGFSSVRVERSGAHVVLLALSQRLDPSGEVSGGGYWLLESRDGAKTWAAPLYTGLRQFRPYALAEQSRLPMLQGTRLRLEASRRELDEASVSFPPIAMRTRPEQSGLVLEADLSALRRDSDGDGLADLVEDRLLLDPQLADTDGDGRKDGRDVLPQVASTPAPAKADLLSALFFELNGNGSRMGGLREDPAAAGASPAAPHLPTDVIPRSFEDVSFVQLDRGLAGGLQPTTPMVFFTEQELTQASRRFGAFYALEVEVYLDATGNEAYLEWNERWRGGSFLAHRKDGVWVLEASGKWVS